MKRLALSACASLLVAVGCAATVPPPPPAPPPEPVVAPPPPIESAPPVASALTLPPPPPAPSAPPPRTREEREKAVVDVLRGAVAPWALPTNGSNVASGSRLVDPRTPGPDVLPSAQVQSSFHVQGGALPDAGSMVGRLRARARACYQKGLQLDPSIHGALELSVVVDPSGQVMSVSSRTTSGELSSAVSSCVAAGIRGATFQPGGGGTLVVKLTMTNS